MFDKPQTSIKKTIKKLIGPSHPSIVKEYVQASKFDHFNIPACEDENFITLALPKEFVIPWQKQRYTHLHFGAVRLALTFHESKGLPVVSRISLLDSRFLEYQNAIIETVQATLNAGTIFVTIFPNFSMSLKDPHLCDALKVQVQITRASQVQDTFAYRLPNHDKKIFASRNTYELVNNRTMRVQTSSWRSSYGQPLGYIFSTIND